MTKFSGGLRTPKQLNMQGPQKAVTTAMSRPLFFWNLNCICLMSIYKRQIFSASVRARRKSEILVWTFFFLRGGGGDIFHFRNGVNMTWRWNDSLTEVCDLLLFQRLKILKFLGCSYNSFWIWFFYITAKHCIWIRSPVQDYRKGPTLNHARDTATCNRI